MFRLLLAACVLVLTAVPGWAQVGSPAAAAAGQTEPETAETATPSWTHPTLSGEVMVTSAYVWRGLVFGDYLNTQPSVSLTLGRITVTSWLNVNGETKDDMFVDEHDLTVEYAHEAGPANLTLAWTNYYFPKDAVGKHANEFSATVGFGGYLNPEFLVSHMTAEDTHGNYVQAGVSHEYAVGGSRATLVPTVTLGYNAHQWSEQRGFSALAVGVTGDIPTKVPHVVLRPFVFYSIGFDDTEFPKKIYGGVSLSLE
jgi:hypothetical protein